MKRYPFGYGKVEPAAALGDRHRPVGHGHRHRDSKRARNSTRRIMRRRRSRSSCSWSSSSSRSCCFAICAARANRSTVNAMRTDAWHHRSDSLTSVAAFIGISIALVGGEGYEPADDWAALFAAAVIAFNGVPVVAQALGERSWTSRCRNASIDDIREIARHVDGVAGIDMCRVRKSGLGLWVDIHVEVPGDMTVRDGHQIAHRVKDALLASGHNVMDAVVHIEPAKTQRKTVVRTGAMRRRTSGVSLRMAGLRSIELSVSAEIAALNHSLQVSKNLLMSLGRGLFQLPAAGCRENL